MNPYQELYEQSHYQQWNQPKPDYQHWNNHDQWNQMEPYEKPNYQQNHMDDYEKPYGQWNHMDHQREPNTNYQQPRLDNHQGQNQNLTQTSQTNTPTIITLKAANNMRYMTPRAPTGREFASDKTICSKCRRYGHLKPECTQTEYCSYCNREAGHSDDQHFSTRNQSDWNQQ